MDVFTSPDVPVGPVARQMNIGSSGGKNMLIEHCKTRKTVTSGADATGSIANQDQNLDSSLHAVTICKNGAGSSVQNNQEAPFVELDVASSTMGEVKMSLKRNLDPSKSHISLDKVFKMVEDKYLHSYNILPPEFSIGKLMNEVCQYVAQLGTVYSEVHGNGGSSQKAAVDTSSPFVKPIACKHAVDGNGNAAGGSSVLESSEPSLQNSIVAWQPELALSKRRPIHDVADISKGEERVRISIVNEFSSESCPPSFYYITYQKTLSSKMHMSTSRLHGLAMKTVALIVLATAYQHPFHVPVQARLEVNLHIHQRVWLGQLSLMNASLLITFQKSIISSTVKLALLKDLRTRPHQILVKAILPENSLRSAGVNVAVTCSVETV